VGEEGLDFWLGCVVSERSVSGRRPFGRGRHLCRYGRASGSTTWSWIRTTRETAAAGCLGCIRGHGLCSRLPRRLDVAPRVL